MVILAYIQAELGALFEWVPQYSSVVQRQQATAILFLTLVTLVLYYYYHKFSYWSSRGIKTPFPLPLVGNTAEMLIRIKRDYDLEWRDKLGKVYGYYHGTKPRLVVADAELLRRIAIKDFNYFPNHEYDPLRNKYQQSFLIALWDNYWKRVRALMTPTFTSGKIKHMYPMMRECTKEMVAMIEEKEGKPVDLKNLVSLYTMDVIASCCFGLKLERATDTNGVKLNSATNSFVDTAMNLVTPRFSRLMARLILPMPILKLIGYHETPYRYTLDLHKKASEIVNTRKRSSRNDYDDYLQLMMNAKLDNKLELNEMDAKENHHAGLTEKSIRDDQERMVDEVKASHQGDSDENDDRSMVRLSEHEIVSNAMMIIVVGYETTSTLMSHCLYTLAHHQEVQEKLYQELKGIAKNDGISLNYDEVTSAVYLDAVISETLRRMSPVFSMDRVCSQDYYLEEYKITIPKGMIINLALYTVMMDPDYWPEPEKFQPERFLPENREKIVPGSFCPFGLGPRHCIGMRFSLTESKIGLARLLLKYRFDPLPGSKFPPSPLRPQIFLNQNGDLFALAKPRSQC